jgi:hypothetical protein
VKSYNLFLDDDENRIPHKLSWIELPLVEWTIVRSYDEFVATIKRDGLPKIVSFDHDLADEHYMEYQRAHSPNLIGERKIQYEDFTEKTGYDCAKWLGNYCIDNGLQLPLYYIHTLNPIGRQNIFSALENARKYLVSFTIPDVTPAEQEAWRQRMKNA